MIMINFVFFFKPICLRFSNRGGLSLASYHVKKSSLLRFGIQYVAAAFDSKESTTDFSLLK